MLSSKESVCQFRGGWRLRFDPWVGRSPGGENGTPLQVFLPGDSHEPKSLAGYNPWGCKESDMTEHDWGIPGCPIRG